MDNTEDILFEETEVADQQLLGTLTNSLVAITKRIVLRDLGAFQLDKCMVDSSDMYLSFLRNKVPEIQWERLVSQLVDICREKLFDEGFVLTLQEHVPSLDDKVEQKFESDILERITKILSVEYNILIKECLVRQFDSQEYFLMSYQTGRLEPYNKRMRNDLALAISNSHGCSVGGYEYDFNYYRSPLHPSVRAEILYAIGLNELQSDVNRVLDSKGFVKVNLAEQDFSDLLRMCEDYIGANHLSSDTPVSEIMGMIEFYMQNLQIPVEPQDTLNASVMEQLMCGNPIREYVNSHDVVHTGRVHIELTELVQKIYVEEVKYRNAVLNVKAFRECLIVKGLQKLLALLYDNLSEYVRAMLSTTAVNIDAKWIYDGKFRACFNYINIGEVIYGCKTDLQRIRAIGFYLINRISDPQRDKFWTHYCKGPLLEDTLHVELWLNKDLGFTNEVQIPKDDSLSILLSEFDLTKAENRYAMGALLNVELLEGAKTKMVDGESEKNTNCYDPYFNEDSFDKIFENMFRLPATDVYTVWSWFKFDTAGVLESETRREVVDALECVPCDPQERSWLAECYLGNAHSVMKKTDSVTRRKLLRKVKLADVTGSYVSRYIIDALIQCK